MYKKIFFTVMQLILVVSTAVANRGVTAAEAHVKKAKELLAFGRWEDAKFELLNAKSKLDDASSSLGEIIDYQLVVCNVELQRAFVQHQIVEFRDQYNPTLREGNVDFISAIEAFDRKDYKAAKRGFEGLNYGDLTSEEAERVNIRMAYIQFKLGNYKAAKKYTAKIPQNSDVYDHAKYYNSCIAYINNDLDSAKKGFSALVSNKIYGGIVPYYNLLIESQQGNYEYVIDNGAKFIEGNSLEQKSREVILAVAEAYFKRGKYGKSVEMLNLYINKGGKIGRNENYMLGFSKYKLGQYADAKLLLREACGADDAMTQNASFHLADCYLRDGDKRQAMYSFAMASNDSFNADIAEDALFNYGKLQYELGGGRFNESINILTRYINKYPKNKRAIEAKKLLVAAYYNSDNYDSAYKAIKEVRNPDAEIRAALQKIAYFRGLEAFKNGDLSRARKSLEESVNVNVSVKYSSLAKFWIGEVDYLEGNYDSALSNYNSYISRAPKGDPTYAMALYSTAYALLRLDREDRALDYFNRYKTQMKADTPLVADANNRIGDILYGQRRFSDASKSYKLAERSENAQKYYAQYQIALIDGIQNRSSDKIKQLEAIVAAGSGDYVESAMYELGRTNISQENYRQAVVILEDFISKYPNSRKYSQALSDLGLSYLNIGDKKNSIKYYDLAIKSAPQSPVSRDAIQGIREIYVDNGDAKGYFKYAEQAGLESDLNEVAKDSLSFASAQRIYLSGKDAVNAESSFEDYIKEYPRGYYLSDALFLVSDCYLKSGKKLEAIESLTTLADRGANQYSEKVYSRLSELTYSQGMYDESAAAYRSLYDVAKDNTEKANAMEGYVDATIKLKNDNRTLKMADDVLSQKNSGYNAILKAKYAKATILRENGEVSNAMKLYKDLSSNPKSAIGAEATYYVISDMYNQGETKKAEDMIFKFSDTKTNQAYWLAKSFITLGDIYAAQNDAFQARATYQSIVDGYANTQDGIIEEAKGKIERLQK